VRSDARATTGAPPSPTARTPRRPFTAEDLKSAAAALRTRKHGTNPNLDSGMKTIVGGAAVALLARPLISRYIRAANTVFAEAAHALGDVQAREALLLEPRPHPRCVEVTALCNVSVRRFLRDSMAHQKAILGGNLCLIEVSSRTYLCELRIRGLIFSLLLLRRTSARFKITS
jgi:hypothetical protein